jgi:purine-binding chemotaxis protein CheW
VQARQELPKQKRLCVFGFPERDFFLEEAYVGEVVENVSLFPIPGDADYWFGALPARGKIIPAVDLSKIYHVERQVLKDIRMVVAHVDDRKIGFISQIATYFVTFDDDIAVDDLIDPRSLL